MMADESMRVLRNTVHLALDRELFSFRHIVLLPELIVYASIHVRARTSPGRQMDKSYIDAKILFMRGLFFWHKTQGNNTDLGQCLKGMAITKATVKSSALLPITVCLVGMGAIMALREQYTWAVCLWG